MMVFKEVEWHNVESIATAQEVRAGGAGPSNLCDGCT